jgi:hypothetical protein
MSLFTNGILLMKTAQNLWRGKKKWKQEALAHTDNYINTAQKNHDKTLTTGIFYKLKDYPYEGLFAANLVANLINYKLTPVERRLISKAGAVLALGDVYCDDTNISFEKMHLMLEEPHQADPINSLDRLFLEIYKDLLIELDDSQQVFFHRTLIQGFEAEKNSRKLKDPNLDASKVKEISKNKGGISLLIYRSLMHIPLDEKEREVLWLAGAFTQLIDDLFDLRWDIEKHTQTSATICTSFGDISNQLEEHFSLLVKTLKNSQLNQGKCREFAFVFYVFKLGADAYINQLRTYCDERIRTEQILSLSKKQLHFVHFDLSNVTFVLPKALRFIY